MLYLMKPDWDIPEKIVSLIDRVEHGHDHDADPASVRVPYTGREIDLSFFSRNRAPPQTSMSVTG